MRRLIKELRTGKCALRQTRMTAGGFTLVELLAVIAIIGILAALLLPALNRSKALARQTQCLSQTKQIALALQMYAQDNGDALPWPNWGSHFQGWLYTPEGGLPAEPSSPAEVAYAGGTLWPYIKLTKIYWCPVDNTNTSYFSQRLEQLSSYIMNGAVMGYGRETADAEDAQIIIHETGAYAAWEPSDHPPYDPAEVFNDGASYPIESEGPSRRHGDGCNVSSFDGHAQLLKYADFEQEQNDTPGMLWCDPDTADGTGGQRGRDCELWK